MWMKHEIVYLMMMKTMRLVKRMMMMTIFVEAIAV
jgi:hypothetical protein